jgi:methylenetetrahydromethanopterin dehydrogenase
MITITFLKLGYIATTTLVDALLDERAARKDIKIRIVSSGVKMDDTEALEVAEIAADIPTDLYIIISPNAALSGPKKARKRLKQTGKPIIIISDEPSRKAMKELPEEIGYIVVYADPMIGAKQRFLDPIEMSIFNSDAIKVLALTGAFRVIQKELDKVIEDLKNGQEPSLPHVIINKELAIENSELQNPYSRAKAMASFEAARNVAKLSTEGTFKIKEKERYIPILASAHELMRNAAKLADEAREIEKKNDTIVRTPHYSQGYTKKKTALMEEFK